MERGYALNVTVEEFARLLDRVDVLEEQVKELRGGDDGLSEAGRVFFENRAAWLAKSRDRDKTRRGPEA